ncbi:MAG: class I fructose-bisphosphate aldolase [Candidatus Saccharibacteria bacterium]|nr:class I fructose-bisphosphate aldolase [Candidatus Saccharibacteria bacterium]
MNENVLENIANQMVVNGKGILAADESSSTADKRFEAVGVEKTEENRRLYRQLLFTTPNVGDYLSGVILYDETFWQITGDGQPFPKILEKSGILPGIKVDQKLTDLPGFPGEKVSKGLDTLPERITKYAENGAKFAKWRSVITIGEGIPTIPCIEANAYVLARYARICQDVNIVPMVEPEVLLEGSHTIEQCAEVLAKTLDVLFGAMKEFRVHLPGAILKTSMVLPGNKSGQLINADQVAELTGSVLRAYVPAELGGVVFLSGGQSSADAMINLNRIAGRGPYPWGLTFSYSRALQGPVLKAWAAGNGGTINVFVDQLRYATAAREGKLDETHLNIDDHVSGSQDL